MIRNSHLLTELRKKEMKADIPFAQKVQRYDEMYEMAMLLNPGSKKKTKNQHLNHIVTLAKRLRELSFQE